MFQSVRRYSTAASSTSSRPSRTPLMVGWTTTCGLMPTRWVGRPSDSKCPSPEKRTNKLPGSDRKAQLPSAPAVGPPNSMIPGTVWNAMQANSAALIVPSSMSTATRPRCGSEAVAGSTKWGPTHLNDPGRPMSGFNDSANGCRCATRWLPMPVTSKLGYRRRSNTAALARRSSCATLGTSLSREWTYQRTECFSREVGAPQKVAGHQRQGQTQTERMKH